METRYIKISKIEGNNGQLEGLPKNPRKTTEEAIRKLMASIEQDVEMLEMRPLLVYPLTNGKYITIGGNMRLEALKRLGWKETCCTILPKDTPVDRLNRVLVKDNASFGEWDWQQLTDGWDSVELMSWEIMPPFHTEEEEEEKEKVQPTLDEQEEVRKRKSWKSERQAGESVSDLKSQPQMYTRHGRFLVASFRKTEKGIPMSECKTEDMVQYFARHAIELIQGVMELGTREGWALITTPRRRHKTWNFADEVCKRIEESTGLRYIPDVAEAKNRHRINPELKLVKQVDEKNVIIYDDILTTGSTVGALTNLLEGKNVIVIIGINNN